jgi:DNA-binding transcriptional regulator YdaS (Cro superfamily)
MLAAATSADNSVAGRVTGELITLTVSPTGTDYEWDLNTPSASAKARSALSASTGSSVTFTPDVGGIFTALVTVDSVTQYVLRIGVTSTALSQLAEAVRQTPKADATVPAPAVGLTHYFSDTLSQWAAKDPSDIVWPLLTGAMGATLTDADATIQIGDGGRRVLPASTLSDNRTITLGTTNAVLGNVIEIARLDVEAFTLAIVNGGVGAGTLATFAVSAREYASFRFDGTNWALWTRRPLS